MINPSQSEKTKETNLLNIKSGANSTRRLMTPSIKNVNLSLVNSNIQGSKDKKIISSSTKLLFGHHQKENVNKQQSQAVNPSKSKRKFTDVQKEKEEAKKQLSNILIQVDALYENRLEDEEFSKTFEEILNKEKILDYSRLIPSSLNAKGSCLLEHSKFYILYIRYKYQTSTDSFGLRGNFQLEDFVSLIDNCLMYDQDDIRALYEFFLHILRSYYSKEEIFIKLQKKEENQNLISSISRLEDLKESHFKFIIAKPESFLKFELEKEKDMPTKSVPISSKKKFHSNKKLMKEHLEKSPAFKNLLNSGIKQVGSIILSEEPVEDEANNSKSKVLLWDNNRISLIEEDNNPDQEKHFFAYQENDKEVTENVGTIILLDHNKEQEIELGHEALGHEENNLNAEKNLQTGKKSKQSISPKRSSAFASNIKEYVLPNEGLVKDDPTNPNENRKKQEDHSSSKSASDVKSKINRIFSNNSPSSAKIIEHTHFPVSTSILKSEKEEESSPSEVLRISANIIPMNTVPSFNGSSIPNSNTNFNSVINNLHHSFNNLELSITSFSSCIGNSAPTKSLSSDAQILYQEMILRNKVDLEIEKNSLLLKGNTNSSRRNTKKKNFKMQSLEKFSLISEEKVIKGESLENNVEDEKEKKKNLQNKITRKKKSKTMIKKEEDEEKYAEDIDSGKSDEEEDSNIEKSNNTKKTKGVKNKKRFQSDVKVKIPATNTSDDEIESKDNTTKNRRKSKKDENKEDTRRGRKSSIMEVSKEKPKKEKAKRSSSASPKESENEAIQTRSKSRTKQKEKREKQSKSTTRGKKK